MKPIRPVRRRLISMAALPLALLAALPSNALAVCCGDGAITVQGLSGPLASIELAVRANTAALAAITKIHGLSNIQSQDIQSTNVNHIARAGARITVQNELAAAPFECRTATLGAHMGTAANIQTAYARRNNMRQAVVNMSSTRGADIDTIVGNHLNYYAGEQDIRAGRQVGSAAGEKALHNADLLYDTLAGGATSDVSPGKSGADNANATVDAASRYTLGPRAILAAQRFIENVTAPFKLQAPPAGAEKTPGGRQALAQQYAFAAQVSVPQRVMNDMLATRHPSTNLGDAAKRMWGFVFPGYKDLTDLPAARSYRELLELEVARRYQSPDWYVHLAGTNSTNALLKEQLAMQALDLHLKLQMYKQNENIQAMLAVLSANSSAHRFNAN